MSQRDQVIQVKLTGPDVTLDDLRWLVQQCTGYSADSRVEIKGHDVDPEELIIHGKPQAKSINQTVYR